MYSVPPIYIARLGARTKEEHKTNTTQPLPSRILPSGLHRQTSFFSKSLLPSLGSALAHR